MFWKISDFVEQIKVTLQESRLHINTVDGWFKKLEEERIHYISRTVETNEKIYDELDLKIAVFIKQKRNDKWSLSAIFTELQNKFDLRAFPVDGKEATNAPQIVDINMLKKQIVADLKDVFEEVAAAQVTDLKNHFEGFLKQLPVPRSKEEHSC